MENLLSLSGFFGCFDSDALRIPVHKSVKKIRLELLGGNKEILNLKGIGIFPSVDGLKYKCRQSSIHESQKRNSYSLMRNKSIHTKNEFNPYWEIIFQSPNHVDYIEIFNRPDKWAVRSRNLVVSVVDADDEYQVLKCLGGISEQNKVLDYFSDHYGHNFFFDLDFMLLKEKIASSILSNEHLPMVFYRQAIQLVDIWYDNKHLDNFESTVLAGYLIKQEMLCGSTSVKMFSSRLSSIQAIEAVQKSMHEVSCARGHKTYNITRHGVQPIGVLASHKLENLQLMSKVIEEFRVLGHQVVLGYGTLLGAVRNGKFLPHDDDIDLIYFSKELSVQNVKAEINSIMSHFESMGYGIKHALSRRLNVHIVDEKNGVKVDVFPCWQSPDGKFFNLHMHKMKIEEIHREYLDPIEEVELEQQAFPVPKNANLFLSARYGEGWKNEDPYFDWPWPLADHPGKF